MPAVTAKERTWSFATAGCSVSAVALAAAPALRPGADEQTRSDRKPAAATQRAERARQRRRRPARRRPRSLASPHTLAEALAATYANQPALQAERAKLRATDENVPQALAGWRPTVVMAGTAGYGDGVQPRIYSGTSGVRSTRRPIGSSAPRRRRCSQPLYTGGKTQANVNRAKNQVMAERATLIAQEQTSFTNVVNAYVGVIQAQQLLALNDQQRAGAGQAAPGDQRPVPGRRDHPDRRGAGRGGAGQRDGADGRPRRAICRRRAARISRWSATCRRAIWSSRSRWLCRSRPSRTRR